MMMARTESRGHLYGASGRPVIRVSTVVILFAAAYAVLVLVFGILPLNMMLRRFLTAASMPKLWRESMVQLAERTLVAAVTCWIGLAISGRGRARLTGSGMLAVGALMSGALAGALDVGLHHFGVTQLVRAAHTAPIWGGALSLGMTAIVTLVVTLLLITRSTRVLTTDS
jgi:hypothetical protein